MANTRIASLVVAILTSVLLLVSILSPWWTQSVRFEFGLFGQTIPQTYSDSAGPFDAGRDRADGTRLIDTSDAVIAGLLGLVALLSVLSAVGILGVSLATNRRIAWPPWLLVQGAFLGALALLLAVVSWPEGDIGFWDGDEGDAGSIETYADVGWYLGVFSVVGATVAAFLAFASPMDSRPSRPRGPAVAVPSAAMRRPSGPVRPATGAPPAAGGFVARDEGGIRGRSLKCPKCFTSVRAPGIRPATIVCPGCGFTSTLR